MSNQVYSNLTHMYPVDTADNPNLVTLSTTQTLSNKTLDASTTTLQTLSNKIVFTVVGSPNTTTNIVASPTANRQLNLPDVSGTLVTTDATQTLSNKTIQDLSATGNITFDGVTPLKIYQWNMQTTNAGTSATSFPVAVGRPFTAVSVVSAIVTAGALLNKSLSRQTSTLLNAISGTVVLVSDYQQIGGNEDAGTNAAVLQHLGVAGNITASVTGVAGNTIQWYGKTYIYG